MNLRPEAPSDREAIRFVHTASFPTAAEARLVDALRAAGRLLLSLVADVDGAVVGHVAVSPVTTRDGAVGAGLAPVAVLPAFRRRGIAEQLVRRGLAECRERADGFVVVLGDPGYYRRFGFEAASRWGLRDEFGGGEHFQVMELRANAIPAGGGLVRYAPEFAALESETGGQPRDE